MAVRPVDILAVLSEGLISEDEAREWLRLSDPHFADAAAVVEAAVAEKRKEETG